MKMLTGLPQQCDKLVFVGLSPGFLSLRESSAHWSWQSPYLVGKCIDNCPTGRGNTAFFGRNRYLVPFNGGIATPVCALARNDSISLQTTIYLFPLLPEKAPASYLRKQVLCIMWFRFLFSRRRIFLFFCGGGDGRALQGRPSPHGGHRPPRPRRWPRRSAG